MKTGLNGAIGTFIPEQRLHITSADSETTLVLSPLSQLGAAAVGLVLVGWAALSTGMLAVQSFGGGSEAARADVMRSAYEARIASLVAERDRYALEAQSAHTRFGVALQEVAAQQDNLLAAMREKEELDRSLGAMRARLDEVVDERDAARAEFAALQENQERAADGLADAGESPGELRDTLQSLTVALDDTARARDDAAAEKESLAMEVAGLELRMQVNAERQDRMVTRLEEAVEVSFGPLEGAFEQAGLDVDELVSSVRRSYSGTGGPLVVASASSRNFDDPELNDRFHTLMQSMDRLNLMQVAASKIPYAQPVTSGFRFTSGFGVRRDPKTGARRQHNGLDFASGLGTPIHATGDGTVVFAGRQSGFGNLIKVRHEFGFESYYAHLNRIRVKVGDRVSRGDLIGDMGTTGRSTGVHLHYEIRVGGKPVNPMTYIKAGKNVF